MTGPAPGVRRGWARRRTGRGPRRTTWRSIATSARSGWTSRPRRAPRSCAGSSAVATSSSRTSAPAGSPAWASTTPNWSVSTRALVHLAISGLRARRPGRRSPWLRLRHPGVERAHVDHRRGRRRRRRPDEGRRGDQRRDDRDARRGQHPRRRSSPGSGRPDRDPGLGQRIDVSLLAATLSALVNQAQNAFVSGAAPGPTRERPPQHRPVRDVRDGRRRDRGRGGVGAAVAAPVRRARPAGARGRPDASPRTAIAWNVGPSCGPPWPSDSRSAHPRTGSRLLEAAEIPAGPINDVLAAFASPEAVARGMTVEIEHPAWGLIRQVGIPFELSATPGVDPRAAAAPRPGLGRDPRRPRLRHSGDRGAPRGAHQAGDQSATGSLAARARAAGTTRRRRPGRRR